MESEKSIDLEKCLPAIDRLITDMKAIQQTVCTPIYPGQFENIARILENAQRTLRSLGYQVTRGKPDQSGISRHSIELLTQESAHLLEQAKVSKNDRAILVAFTDTSSTVSQILESSTIQRLITSRNEALLSGEPSETALGLFRILVELEASRPLYENALEISAYYAQFSRIFPVLRSFYRISHKDIGNITKRMLGEHLRHDLTP